MAKARIHKTDLAGQVATLVAASQKVSQAEPAIVALLQALKDSLGAVELELFLYDADRKLAFLAAHTEDKEGPRVVGPEERPDVFGPLSAKASRSRAGKLALPVPGTRDACGVLVCRPTKAGKTVGAGWQQLGLVDCRVHVLQAGHFFPQTHTRQLAYLIEQELLGEGA